jgi:diguanylate cyclase (GGDEF)-like protein
VADEVGAKEQLESRLAELQAVVRITETIHSSLDLDAVGIDVLEILGAVLGIDRCSLFVIDKKTTDMVFSASRGDVARSVETPLQQTSGSSEHFSCKAVCDRGDAIVLFCADQADMDQLSTADGLLLNAVASQLVVAVENSHLYGLTKVLSITDELTGLYNYRELQSRLNQEIERATRYESTLSLLMIDADDFKSYNDTYGHVAGDNALFELAGVMRAAVREVDFVARYGGEEFTVILPETDSAGAFVVAEKIREAVADHDFAEGEAAVEARGPLTVSVGIATFPTYADDTESLLRQADNALYRAKREGRNRVRTPQLVVHNDTHDAEDTTGD